jgi:hypothetical protein
MAMYQVFHTGLRIYGLLCIVIVTMWLAVIAHRHATKPSTITIDHYYRKLSEASKVRVEHLIHGRSVRYEKPDPMFKLILLETVGTLSQLPSSQPVQKVEMRITFSDEHDNQLLVFDCDAYHLIIDKTALDAKFPFHILFD